MASTIRIAAFATLAGLIYILCTASGEAEPRVALVIGNAAYNADLGTLNNPTHDAQTVGSTLRRLGFDVDVQTDVDQKRMKRAIARLGQRLRDAGRNSTGIFYYAGHGLEVQGENFLVPTDAEIHSEADINVEAISANDVFDEMQNSPSGVNIVILDACRNSPTFRSITGGDRGFALKYPPTGAFIAYSTAPGHLASDGQGSNSPFAVAFASEIQRPGQEIDEVFKSIRRRVVAETQNEQIPGNYSNMLNDFFFIPPASAPGASTTVALADTQPDFDRSTAGIAMRGISADSEQEKVLKWLDGATRLNLVTIAANRAELFMGDSVRFRVTSHVEGWVSVFDIGPDGKVKRLYPLSEDEARTYIHSGETKQVPGVVGIEPPLGKETILAFVTKKPLVRFGTSTLCSRISTSSACFEFYERLDELTRTWTLVDPQTGIGDWAVGAAHYVSSRR
ncbi:MAG: caspase family protein [Rhizomicrobium sp.]|jgi:uncharacterized caspase-like protein